MSCSIKRLYTMKVYLRDLPFTPATCLFLENRGEDIFRTKNLYLTCSGQTVSKGILTKPNGIEGFQAEPKWPQGVPRGRDALTDGQTLKTMWVWDELILTGEDIETTQLKCREPRSTSPPGVMRRGKITEENPHWCIWRLINKMTWDRYIL